MWENLDHGFKSRLCHLPAVGLGQVTCLPAFVEVGFQVYVELEPLVQRLRHQMGTWCRLVPKSSGHSYPLYRLPMFFLQYWGPNPGPYTR